MGRVLYIVRVMPADSDVAVEELLKKIAESLPQGVELRDYAKESMGFGIESLVLALSLPEEEGITEKVEEGIRSVEGVGEVQVEGLTRER